MKLEPKAMKPALRTLAPAFDVGRLRCFLRTAVSLALAACILQSSSQGQAQEAIPASLPVAIQVNLTQTLGPYLPLYAWFGYDESNYTTTPLGRALLGELHDLSPEPITIRAHHLLTSGDGVPALKWSSTGVYRIGADGKPIYDFHILDGIFDAYKAAGVRPMVELGFMPEDLAATLPNQPHQPYKVLYPKDTTSGASNNPPKDYARWEQLVQAVTAHLVERYGADEVRHWNFEVWNEPDISYWHGSMQDYFRLYDFAVAGVRAALPDAHVGGPATTSPRGSGGYNYLRAFLEHVATGTSAATGGTVPLDFISFHAKGQPTIRDGHVTMGLRQELEDVDRGLSLIATFPGLDKLPIILSEADPEGCAACSSKVNPANNYRNGMLYPAYTAAAYKGIVELADEHHANIAGMLSWSFEFEGRDYFEGFRSLATNGIDKPVLNVFRMLGLMHGNRVATSSTGAASLPSMLGSGVPHSDVDALATTSDHAAQVLLWNYQDEAAAGPSATTTTTIRGLPVGITRVLLRHYRIDDTHSNAYTVWQAMGRPQQPTADQLAQLRQAGQLQLLTSPAWIDVTDGTATVPLTLPSHAISLLSLTW
jgi:xylan 1,4-beta-xylosidase